MTDSRIEVNHMKNKLFRALKNGAAVLLAASVLLAGCARSDGAAGTAGPASAASGTSGSSESSSAEVSGQPEAGTESASSQESTASGSSAASSAPSSGAEKESAYLVEAADAPDVAGMECEGKMKLDYAECFDIYYYEGGYALIDVHESASYLLVPEGAEVPDGLEDDIKVLQQPLDKIYLAATSAMALFRALDSMDQVRMTGTNASGWYIEEAVEAINSGKMLFAGKYSEPDYELLVNENCNLAIESTMILHSPKVQEMIEDLDIPVFIDRSSYETHPLGRTEWVKLYGAMMDKEDEAVQFFEGQAEVISELKDFPNTEKKVAFFYVSTDGSIVVRRTTDYIPRMIDIAGGRYAFQDPTGAEATSSSVSLSMEEFYATAADADYLVYNATIDNPVSTMEELTAKDQLFEDFKAVKEGNVWCVGKYMYQATDIVGQLITDFHLMLTGGDPGEMTFLTKVD